MAARADVSASSAPGSATGLLEKLRGHARRLSLLTAVIALALGGFAQYSLARDRIRTAMIGYGVAAILFVSALRKSMPNDFAGPCAPDPSQSKSRARPQQS